MDKMPKFIFLNIISYLDFKDICRCEQVSRRWRGFIDNYIWEPIFNRNYITKIPRLLLVDPAFKNRGYKLLYYYHYIMHMYICCYPVIDILHDINRGVVTKHNSYFFDFNKFFYGHHLILNIRFVNVEDLADLNVKIIEINCDIDYMVYDGSKYNFNFGTFTCSNLELLEIIDF